MISMRATYALIAVAVCVLIIASCQPQTPGDTPSTSKAIPAKPAAGPPAIEGAVTVVGTPPQRRQIRISADKKCVEECGSETIPGDELVVNGNRLQWVLVSIKDARKTAARLPRAQMQFIKCRIDPHVLGVMVNQEVKFGTDGISMHDWNLVSDSFFQFSGISPFRHKQFILQPETDVRVKCNVHKWEAAWIQVFNHPYFAVTDEHGKYRIEHVPEGEWTLQAWHEKLGEQSARVNVGKGTTTANFEFHPNPERKRGTNPAGFLLKFVFPSAVAIVHLGAPALATM